MIFPLMRINFICAACPQNDVGQAEKMRSLHRKIKPLCSEESRKKAFYNGKKLSGPPKLKMKDPILQQLCWNKFCEQEVKRLDQKLKFLMDGPLSENQFEEDQKWKDINERMIKSIIEGGES